MMNLDTARLMIMALQEELSAVRDKAEKDRDKAEKDRDESNERVAALIAALDKAENDRDETNKSLDRADARAILFSSFSHKNVQDLIRLIDRSELESVPEDFLINYTTAMHDPDTSLTFANDMKSSVTASESAHDVLRLNTMRRRMTNETSSKILVMELNLSAEDTLDDELCGVLFKTDKAAFNLFVETQSIILDKVRRALFHIWGSRAIREVEELQPYAMLLLEEFVREFHSNAVVSPGQRVPLEGMLVVGEDANTAVTKTIRGFTDLIVHETDSDANDASNAICIFELKASMGKLFHSAAAAAKDQLLFEMEILGQMDSNLPSMVMGGLTDLFAIAIAVRKVVDGVCTFYVSPRVTGLKEFVRCLLLLLCRDKDSLWVMLLQQSTQEVALEEDEEEVGQDEGGHGEGSGNVENDDSSGAGPRDGKENYFSGIASVVPGEPPTSLSLAKEAAIALSKLRAMDRVEEHNEAVSRLLSWDNKRKGLATLTSDALNKMNAELSKS